MSAHPVNLKAEIFEPVAERVKIAGHRFLSRQADRAVRGIEGWFEYYVVDDALDHLHPEHNPAKGADLLLADGRQIEIKGSTNCDTTWILTGLKYGTPCLFLAGGSNISACLAKLAAKSKVVAYERFFVGKYEWIVGLIEPAAASAAVPLPDSATPGAALTAGPGW